MLQDKEAERILNRYQRAKEQRQKYNYKWAELDRFYRGDQYNNEKIPAWVPKPVTNFIHLVVTTKRAALSLENPSALLKPISAQDTENVMLLQKVLDWVWKKLNVRKVVRENIETATLLGTAIAHVYWDEKTGVKGRPQRVHPVTGQVLSGYYEGEIKVCEIDPACFFPDPNAYRLEDCQYVHIVEKKPRVWVEKYFGVKLEDFQNDQRVSGDIDIYERNRYTDTTGGENSLVDFHSHYEKYWNDATIKETRVVQKPIFNENGEIVDYHEVEEEHDTGEEIGGWNYKVTYVVGGKVVGSIDPLEPNMYPFAILYDYPQKQEFFGLSTASLILDNQKLINKVESIVAMIGTLLQNPQKIVYKASGINPQDAMKYSTAPGHVFVSNVDPRQAIQWQDVPQIPPSLLNIAEAAKQNIREITGLNEAYMGQSVGSLQTSAGVNSLIDRATMRDKDKMFDIELYIEQLTRLLLAFVVTKYTEERYIRVVEDPTKEQQTTKFLEFIGTDYRDLEYDIEVDVSGKAPISLMRQQQEAKERLNLQGQYSFNPRIITPQEYILATDQVDKHEIVARMNQEERMSNLKKLQTVAEMMNEAMLMGMPPDEIMKMADEHLTQLEQGTAPVSPFDPAGIDQIGQDNPLEKMGLDGSLPIGPMNPAGGTNPAGGMEQMQQAMANVERNPNAPKNFVP